MMNGKGSRPRPTDNKRFGDNWDRIFGDPSAGGDPDDDRPWGYAGYRDAERWTGPFQNRQDAIERAIDNGEIEDGDDELWVCRCAGLDPEYLSTHLAVDYLIDDLNERAYEHWGDLVEDNYLSPSPEALAELRVLVLGWVRKHALGTGAAWEADAIVQVSPAEVEARVRARAGR